MQALIATGFTTFIVDEHGGLKGIFKLDGANADNNSQCGAARIAQLNIHLRCNVLIRISLTVVGAITYRALLSSLSLSIDVPKPVQYS